METLVFDDHVDGEEVRIYRAGNGQTMRVELDGKPQNTHTVPGWDETLATIAKTKDLDLVRSFIREWVIRDIIK